MSSDDEWSPFIDASDPCEASEDETCWICLSSELERVSVCGMLIRACACPRLVHQKCLARWQLQQAGKKEEKHCRFCLQDLPDWKTALTPPELAPADPVMVVALGDKLHRIKVKPGPEGQREFKDKIRVLFNIPDNMDFDVSFRCKAPCTDRNLTGGADLISLEGMDSYEAATHCASVMAAQRQAGAASPSDSLLLSPANRSWVQGGAH